MGPMKLNEEGQALFDRLTAFNNRHKARAEEEQASNREVFKDIIIKPCPGNSKRLPSAIRSFDQDHLPKSDQRWSWKAQHAHPSAWKWVSSLQSRHSLVRFSISYFIRCFLTAKSELLKFLAYCTTLEDKLIQRDDNPRKNIEDRETKLQVQIKAAAKLTKDLEDKLLQRDESLKDKVTGKEGEDVHQGIITPDENSQEW